MVMPTTRWPASTSRPAAVALSTPPESATTIVSGVRSMATLGKTPVLIAQPVPARELTLSLEDFDDEGAGFGRDPERSGGVVHVRAGLPGEKLRVRVDHQSPHKPESWASIVDVLTASPDRREP